MARFGVFCMPLTGHLNPLATLARELTGRGHQVTFFNLPDFAAPVQARGLDFVAYGEREFPVGTFAERYRALSRLAGLDASRANLDILTTQADALFDLAPAILERAGLDLWLVDHMDYAPATLAAHMGAPFVSVIVGLMRHAEEGVPGFSGEPYSDDPAVLERDRHFNEAMLAASRPFRDHIGAYRIKSGLGPFSFDTLWSSLAQITQEPAEFEFPRRQLPACFHFTGPFVRASDRPPTPFPWERLEERKPLIYASFGTTQNRNTQLYDAVTAAAAGLDAQVVLSLGGAETANLPTSIPPNLIVVPFAPQVEILARADLMITHAGMNSTLECLAAGVPMVAVPIAHDQPGIAARIEWTGCGVRVPAAECDGGRLRSAIEKVRGDDSYRQAALRFKNLIARGRGLQRAADIIERVAATGQPVLR